MGRNIDLYERYSTNTQEEIEWYDQLGLPLPETFDYRIYSADVDKIEDVKQESELDSKIFFYEGFELIVFGNADELFIKINDLKNNEIEYNEE